LGKGFLAVRVIKMYFFRRGVFVVVGQRFWLDIRVVNMKKYLIRLIVLRRYLTVRVVDKKKYLFA
jgi:hypothetical protein